MSRPYAKGKKPYVASPQPPIFEGVGGKLRGLVAQVLKLPRIWRVLIVSACALAVLFAIFPIVDQIYLQYFFDDLTRILPSFVSVGIGIIIYMIGWRLIVGTVGEEPVARVSAFWFLIIGLLAALVVVTLLLQGYSMVSDPSP